MRTQFGLLVALMGAAISITGCTEVTNVSPADSASFSFADYMWPGASRSFTMTDERGSVTWQDSMTATNILLTTAGHQIVVASPQGQTHAQGFYPGSLIDLDPASYFSAIDTVERFVNVPRAAVYLEAGNAVCVGTDSGVFTRQSATSLFRYAGLAGSVTALAANPAKGIVYVGMKDGSIWNGSDNSWNTFPTTGLPAGAVQSLAFGVDNTLYCAIAGTNGFYKYSDASNWQPLPYMSSQSIKLLHSFSTVSPRVQKVIVAATNAGMVGVFNLDGTTNPDPKNIASAVNGFTAGDGGALLTATSGGVLSGDLHSNTWSALSTPISGSVTAVHSWNPGSGSTSLFNASATRVMYSSLTGAGQTVLPSAPPGDVIALGHLDQKLYAITTRGAFEYQSQWVEVPGLANESAIHREGPIVLAVDPLKVGSHWGAGTLVTKSDDKAYAIVGRVLTHYDTLKAGTVSFADVLVLRFAHELPDGAAESTAIPYWVLYFARGRGLVMSEKVKSDSVISRQVLTAFQ